MKTHTSPEPLEARIAPATFHWDVVGSGNWNDQNNWFNETSGLPDNGFPNAVDDVAKFTNANAAGAVVTINGVPITVGSILFDDDSSYTVAAAGGGTLTLSSAATAAITISRNNGDAPHAISAPLTLASPLLFTHNATSAFTISSAVGESAAGMAFTKVGAGPLTLSNPGGTPLPNTFTGALTVQEGGVTFLKSVNTNAFGGSLVVGGAGTSASVLVLGTNQIPNTSAVTINALGSVTLNISEQLGALTINGGTFSLGANGGTVLIPSSLTMTGGSVVMSVASQSVNLGGDVIATSDANGPATISGGQVGLGSAARGFTVNDGPQAQDLTISSLIFNGGVVKNGAGTLRFAGSTANGYTATTTVNAGTLELAKVGGSAVNGALTIGDGSGGAEADAVRLILGDQIANNVVVTVNASGLLDMNGQTEVLGSVNVQGGHVTTGASAASLTIATGLTLNAGRLSAAAAGSQITLPASVTVNTAGQSLIDGLGSLVMSALTLNVNNGAADVDLLVTVPLTGGTNVSKTGAGTLELDGANTYTGDTLVFGRLIVNGSIGNVLFGSSQTTLAGSGTVGSIALNAGAVRPGTSPGVLHTGDISGGSGDTFHFEIDGPAPGNGAGFHDQIAVAGTLDLTNVNLSVLSLPANIAAGDQYVLIANDGSDAVTGNFSGLPEGSVTTIGARRCIITYKGGDGNDVVLTPEQAFIIEGDIVPGADDYFVVQRDAADPKLVHVTDYSAYVNPVKTWDISLSQFANIEIHGGAGDDAIYFDAKNGYFASSFANVLYALTFVGAGGLNSATITDTSAATVATASFSTFAGPRSGAVDYGNGFRARFDGTDLFTDEVKVSDYSVFGTLGAPDSFTFGPSYGAGNHAGIAGKLGVELRGKTTLNFYGQGGGDTFDIGLAGIDAPAVIKVFTSAAAGNALSVAGTSGDDAFSLTKTSPNEGVIGRAGQPAVEFSGALRITLDGGAGADSFVLPAADYDVRVVGGLGADTLSFAGSAGGVALSLDVLNSPQTLNAGGAVLTLGDAFENVIGSDGADVFLARPSFVARTLVGGTGADAVIFDALGTAATKTGGTIAAPGFGEITTSGIESATLLNVPAKPVLGAQGNTFAAPLDFAGGKGAVALAAGDLNGDGRADFVTADSKGNTVSIALSSASGLLLPAVQKASGGLKPVSVALADLDGDSDLDIAVSNSGTGTAGVLLNDGAGNFSSATTLTLGKTPGVIRAGDLDGDGDADLVALIGGNRVALVKNTGGGTFAAATSFPSGSLKARDLGLADLDGDGDLDLLVLHSGGQLGSHVNDGTATFATPTIARTGAGATALALADFNGDGKLDAAVTHNAVARYVAVLFGKGDGTFQSLLRVAYPLGAKASAVAASDFDGDGLVDLAIANGAGGRISILRGLGSGAFARALDLSLDDSPPRRLSALVLGDFDGDGRSDLATLGSAAGEVSVLARA